MPKHVPPRPAPPRPAPPAAPAAAAALRLAFRRHAAGVTIVTMTGPAGPVGFTATSVASLSQSPPLVSLSLSASSSIVPTLHAADTLVVHLLSHGQHDLAARFAAPGADRFAAPTRWRQLGTGEPLLMDAAVWLRCRIRERILAGDHWLIVAEVVESRAERSVAPLVYHDGGYGTFVGPATGVPAGEPATPPAPGGGVRSGDGDGDGSGSGNGSGSGSAGNRSSGGGPPTPGEGDLGIRASRPGHPTSAKNGR
ncbi:flavin reductase family protein [Frankia sp. QA3]|uniref:flavin reductase family protein n=1 Tax=Frankia sp. QA3 TaxID=710111 RepID=UPI000269BBBB|nr:flavin reductase family protein [Frankia sp. QA3]EIV91736.1 DIM6/NTAB family protein [Frankia sp. QA3]